MKQNCKLVFDPAKIIVLYVVVVVVVAELAMVVIFAVPMAVMATTLTYWMFVSRRQS